jgi:O-antigen/teichoic acid export membrane protein
MADRMLLNVFLGVTVTGIYNVGFMFGNVMNFITDGFNRAYVPVTMHVLQSREQTQLNQLSGIGLRLVVCYSLLGTLLSFYAKEIITLSTPAAYHGAYVVVPYVAFAFVLQGLYYIFVTILFFVGKATKYIAFGTAAGAVANVVLNLVMIRPYGLRGAAIATLLAQFVVTVFVAILGKAYEPIRWDYPRFSLIVAICLATSLTVMSLPLSVPIAALKLVLFFGLCCTLNLWLWGDALHLMRRGLQLLRSVSPAV